MPGAHVLLLGRMPLLARLEQGGHYGPFAWVHMDQELGFLHQTVEMVFMTSCQSDQLLQDLRRHRGG